MLVTRFIIHRLTVECQSIQSGSTSIPGSTHTLTWDVAQRQLSCPSSMVYRGASRSLRILADVSKILEGALLDHFHLESSLNYHLTQHLRQVSGHSPWWFEADCFRLDEEVDSWGLLEILVAVPTQLAHSPSPVSFSLSEGRWFFWIIFGLALLCRGFSRTLWGFRSIFLFHIHGQMPATSTRNTRNMEQVLMKPEGNLHPFVSDSTALVHSINPIGYIYEPNFNWDSKRAIIQLLPSIPSFNVINDNNQNSGSITMNTAVAFER